MQEVYISNPDYLLILENLFSAEAIGVITPQQMHQISQMATPPGVLAICQLPNDDHLPEDLSGMRIFYLDAIRDPGNLGTILRIADWFGLNFVICSPDCVDIYNHKVLQASMGSALRVRTCEMAKEEVISRAGDRLYSCDMSGKNINNSKAPSDGILILGNESVGVSDEMQKKAKETFSIPGHRSHGAESLNVASAAAIMAAWWMK